MDAWFWIWVAVLFIALLAEFATSDLTSIWFCVGSIGALVVNVCGAAYTYQILTFVAVSIISLFLFRPIVRRKLMGLQVASNIDEIIGKQVVVEKKITPLEAGEVKLGGVIWTAFNEIKSFEEDEIVEVVAIHGNKLQVDTIKKHNKQA